MRAQKIRRCCLDSESGEDFISNLPQSLKDNILNRLNIIEAVRTCILSKKWRCSWCTVPKLVVRSAYFNVDRKLDCNKFTDSLLSHHKGPITKVILSTVNFHYDDLDRWIHLLGNKAVKDLCFDFDMDSCDIPSSFFSRLLALTNLKFRCRTLDVPQLFEGFKLLRKLELSIATMACTDLERLVSKCSLLQYLKLVNMFESFDDLVIQSRSLKKIVVIADYNHLVLDTPKLLLLTVIPNDSLVNDEKYKLVRVSYETYRDGLPNLKKSHTCLQVHLLKTMAKLPIKLNHLTQTVIKMDVSKKDDLDSAVFLFKSAPKLQNLHVKFYNGGDLGAYSNCKSFWESDIKNVFNDLKTVIIQPCKSVTADCTIAIIKFILSTARVLESMIIRDAWVSFMVTSMEIPPMLECMSRSDRASTEMRKAMETVLEVLKLPRMSSKAHINFEDTELTDCMEKFKTTKSSS